LLPFKITSAIAPLRRTEAVTAEVLQGVSAFRWASHDVAAVVALALISALADLWE
jgi:hypothetical protein